MCVNYAPVQRQILRDVFGVEPPSDEWRAEAWPYFPTANARAETIGKLRSFATYWRACQFALIPATAFFEPNWESGKAIRWKIGLPGGQPFAIAGLWRSWPGGAVSFTMPTLNADNHPLMKRFHKPGDEKRGVVLLPEAEWDDWLNCSDPEHARSFLRLYPAESMVSEPAPMPPRRRNDEVEA